MISQLPLSIIVLIMSQITPTHALLYTHGHSAITPKYNTLGRIATITVIKLCVYCMLPLKGISKPKHTSLNNIRR